eukprot:9418214-Ditylum_brightwellii.AAC.1
MRNFWAQNDKRKAQICSYKQLPATKIQRRKNEHEKLKEQVAKQKRRLKMVSPIEKTTRQIWEEI